MKVLFSTFLFFVAVSFMACQDIPSKNYQKIETKTAFPKDDTLMNKASVSSCCIKIPARGSRKVVK